MSPVASLGSWLRNPWSGVALGVIGGLALLAVANLDGSVAPPAQRIAIEIDGLPRPIARDLLLPAHGWVLGVELPGLEPGGSLEGVELVLREERTGMTVNVEDRLESMAGRAGFVVPEGLRLSEGLLAIHATRVDGDGRISEDWHRVRIRRWLGGPPIGSRQIVHLDFEVDRDGDGQPDFPRDLEQAGLASPDHPELAARVADRIAELALERVVRAYSGEDDPNHTGLAADPVHVRFLRRTEPGPFVTRICVGGTDPADPTSVGHVAFDRGNARRASVECGDDGPGGVFPGGLSTYAEDALYRAVFDPLRADRGGLPVGADPRDAGLLEAALARAGSEAPSAKSADGAPSGDETDPDRRRLEAIARATSVYARVLGSILAHEAGHALGLVAPGRPGVGLFGAESGDARAHNLAAEGDGPALMDPGPDLRFAELAGETEAGELRFRPLNYAYLRDRVVLLDARN